MIMHLRAPSLQVVKLFSLFSMWTFPRPEGLISKCFSVGRFGEERCYSVGKVGMKGFWRMELAWIGMGWPRQ